MSVKRSSTPAKAVRTVLISTTVTRENIPSSPRCQKSFTVIVKRAVRTSWTKRVYSSGWIVPSKRRALWSRAFLWWMFIVSATIGGLSKKVVAHEIRYYVYTNPHRTEEIMNHYGHLTIVERENIMMFRRDGNSIGQIAAKTGRHKSTISRELRRNAGEDGKYQACTAPGALRGTPKDLQTVLHPW